MKKVPMPAAIGLVVAALVVLIFSLSRAFQSSSHESGDPTAILKDIQQQTPANAPALPPGINPTEGAVGRGGGSKKH